MKTISITFISVLLSVVCYAQYLDSNDPGGGITAQSDTSVGVLPGSFGVSPSGGATYTIPLDLPAGRAGIKPDIAFVYNSQQKFGNILGQGWSLTGFSAITRSNPTLYYNGGNDNIDFVDDELLLDGQHLIEVNQNEYRTEIDGISKIVKLDGTIGEYFKVYTKDGLIIEYGNTVDSRQVYSGNNTDGVPLAWHINKITDRMENNIVYTYERAQQNGELHPEDIFYTGHDSKTLGCTKISFIYQSTSMDSEIQHISYFEKNQLPYVNKNSWLLEKIQISNDDGTEPIKDYVISYYEQAGACKEFFVKDITPVNYEKGIATPIKPTRFYWDFYQPGYQQFELLYDEMGMYNNYSFKAIGLDMDGNKHDEIAFYFIERYYDEFGTFTDQKIIKVYGLIGGAIILPVSELFYNLYSIDWDNNGDDELLFVDNDGIKIYDFTNGALSQVYTNSLTGKIYTGDINGDAINDVLIEQATTLLVLEGYYNTSGTVDYIQSQYTLPLSANLSIRTVADMNGDGNIEVLCKGYEDRNFPTYTFSTQSGFSILNNFAISDNVPTDSKFYYADFNGDGKTDICYLKEDNGSFIQNTCFSYGNNFTVPQTSDFTYDDIPMFVLDINNDGRADFVYFDTNTGHLIMKCYITNPDGISSQFQGTIELTGEPLSCNKLKIITANLIPNGTMDFIFIFEKLVNDPGSPHQHWDELYLCSLSDIGIGNNVIKMIRDGFVVKTQITYSDFGTTGPLYSDFPVAKPRFRDNVVSESYVEGDNSTKWNWKKYTFNTPITHLQGKGFLGYKETRVLSLQNNLLSITENNIHVDNDKYFYTYPMKSSTWSVVNEVQDKLLSETTNLVDLKKLNSGTLNFLPVVIQNITKSWDNDDAHTFKGKKVENQELSDIDDYGNILRHTTLMDENEFPVSRYAWEHTIEMHYIQPDEASWLVSLPDSSKTTMYHKPKAAAESTLTNETYFHYYSAFPYLEYKENIPNSNTDLKTQNWYTYDSYGNITSETIKATINGATKERKTEFGYLYSEGYQSRFLTSKTVKAETAANDQIYTYTYNRYTGRIETSQDLNELGLTTYEYDDQGRLSKTTLPDLTQKVTFVNWSANFSEFTPPANALYYTLSYKNLSDASERWHNTCIFFDKYQRVIFAATQGLNGNYYKTDQTFDNKGRVSQVSEPSPLNNTSGLYTTYEYDNLGKLVSQTLPSGAVITTEYAGFTTRVTNTASGIWKETTVNILGNPQTVTDPTAEPVEYIYDAASRVSSFGTQDAMTTFEYDDAGNRTRVTDPDAGITQYTYNALGELLTQTDARGSTFTNTYDELGRLETSSLTPDNISTIYTYNERSDYGFGQIQSVIQRTDGTDVSGIHYQYDMLGRLTSKVTNYEESSYGFEYEYSTKSGMLEYYTYPSLYKIKYEYNAYGYMTNVVENSTSNILWTAVGDNPRGQLTDFTLGNGLLATHKEFDPYGFPSSITTVNPSTNVTVQDIDYRFDPITGNLDERTELITPGNFLTESYTYDGILHSRLSSWQVDGSRNYGMKYSNNGNILTKADITQPPTMPKDGTPVGTEGQYTYGNNAGPHAVTGITLPTAEYLATATPQTITYNGFNKVSSILDNHEYGLNIDYGPDYQRIRSAFFRKNDPRSKYIQFLKIKYFIDDFEIEKYWENETEVTRQLHYLSSSSGIFAIIETKNGVTTPYYIHKDHLGNYNVITGGNGQVVEKLNFDPWGQRRNPTDWSYTNVPTSFLFDRGYTGHEHLDKFGLINMNGRVYDPRLARFLSPDPILQDPTNSQGHNRYSYCLNNPLRYVDPSGYFYGKFDRPGHPLSENRENTPIITLESLFNGGLGSIGPGSMNHWSDAYRDNYSLYFLMNTTKFDNMIANQLSSPYHYSQVAIPYASKNGVTFSGGNAQELCSAIVDPEIYIYRVITPYDERLVASLGEIGEMTIHENGAPMFENKTAGVLLSDVVAQGGGGDYSWAKNTQTGMGAFDIGNSVKGGMINYAVASSARKSMNSLKRADYVATLGKTGANYFRALKITGGVTFGVSTLISTGLTYNYYNSGGTGSDVLVKSSLDVAMGVVGLFWPIGTAISATYFIIDVATGGFGGYGDPFKINK